MHARRAACEAVRMGWKGLVRSYVASQRREAREQQRVYRAAEKQALAEAKVREMELAAHVVDRYEQLLRLLSTVHHDCRTPVDWKQVASLPTPTEPPPETGRTTRARADLESYRPGIVARVFGGARKQRAALEVALEEAGRQDANATDAAREKYALLCREVEEARVVAAAVLKGDHTRYADALQGADAFDELAEIATRIAVEGISRDVVRVEIDLPAVDQVVPDEQHTLTGKGKLSTKALAKTRRNEIYQDYVCGAALRACREVFAALPVQWACVSVRTALLDSASGHTGLRPVVSLIALRETVEKLNYEALDPSDGMKNFLHRMGFKKSSGLSAVEALGPADVPRAQSSAGSS
jgi:hypothetical protein